MKISEKAEELLENLWILTEESHKTNINVSEVDGANEETCGELTACGYIYISNGEVKLTENGRTPARSIVRRHRLAERLLADVLNSGEGLMHERACRFEHILDDGLDESICSLLGHPKICPHGKTIPPGKCCLTEKKNERKIVSPLSQLPSGFSGKVSYIHTADSEQLQKLMAMGILPGEPVTLLQDFPSYVFQVRQAQFAVDKDIANSIYVRLIES